MSMTLPPQIIEAAATWYVDLRDREENDELHEAHGRWLAECPEHRQAWTLVEKMQQQTGDVPRGMGSALNTARLSRRQSIKVLSLAMLAVSGGVVWQQRSDLFPAIYADFRTAIGERLEINLTDGGLLQLNTATAVDVTYSLERRELQLHQGEIQIQTAADERERPFVVHTRHGSIRALGTRFLVSADQQQSRVTVLEHAVEVRPADAPQVATRIDAGQQLLFEQQRVGSIQAVTAEADAWTRGLLVVSNWRLVDFINELSRYHRGYLHVNDAVVDLRISGAFQLDNTRTVLENLTTTLPIELREFTPYITRLEPKR